MENYYLLAAICCLLLLISGGFLFTRQKRKIQTQSSQIVQTVEQIMTQQYVYLDKAFQDSCSELYKNLKKVDRFDPKKRPADSMDDWFKSATSELMHDGWCLSYINTYGHLEDAFWKNIKICGINPEKDKKFQQLLVSVSETNLSNFGNLLFYYGQHYKLLPEIEYILKNDTRFKRSKETYEFAQECAKTDSY